MTIFRIMKTTIQTGLFKKVLFLHLSLSCILSFSGCNAPKTHTCVKNGQEYCITGDWVPLQTWDACYRRGISCMEGTCWDYAVEEFQKAIKLKFKDERNVRAYGMHFRDEYFPHREMGISLLHMGRFEEAMDELELSLNQTPSARAKYYLNQARRSHLLATAQDTAPPVIHLSPPEDAYLTSPPEDVYLISPSEAAYLTNQTPLKIEGNVADDQFVAAISVNQTPLFIELAKKEVPFTFPVHLREGWNNIEISATDLVDKEEKRTIRVHLDQQGPFVIIRPTHEDQDRASGRITLNALIYDRSGIVSFTINHEEISRYGLDRLCLIEEAIPLPPNVMSIPFSALDRAGNITQGEISLLPSRRRHHMAFRLACSDPSGLILPPGPVMASNTENEDITLDILYPRYSTEKMINKVTTYAEDIFLQAEIDARNGIKKIEVILDALAEEEGKGQSLNLAKHELTDGEEIEEYAKSNYQELILAMKSQNYDPEKGMKILDNFLKRDTFGYVHKMIHLEKNFRTYSLTVKARDYAEKEKTERIQIEKRPREEIFKSEEKMKLAILPFDMETDSSYHPDRRDYIHKMLYESFIFQDRFNLFENEGLPWPLIEKGCESGKICEEDMIQKIAVRTNAEGIVCGRIRKWMDGGVEIKAYFKEPEQGETCLMHDVFTPLDTSENLKLITMGMAVKFRESFPVCTGEIINKQGELIYANIGASTGIFPCMRYNIYRDENKEELRNKAIVKEVDEDSSKAQVIEEEKGTEIQEGYRVRTR